MIEAFSINAMSKTTEATFCEAALSMHDCLPLSVQRVFDAAAAFDSLKSAADGIRESNNQLGALEMTLLLSKVKAAEDSAQTMAAAREHKEDAKLVTTHWWLKVESHAVKCDRAKILSTLLKKYGNLPEAIKTWNFEKLPWMTVEHDAERDKLGQDVQEILMVFPTWSSVMERIGKEMEPFANKEMLKVVCEAVATTRTAATQVQEAKKLMANMIMAGQFLQGEKKGKTSEEVRNMPDYANALKYVKSAWKIQVSDFPSQLQDRMLGKDILAETAAASSSSTTTPVQLANETANDLPKKKKQRKTLVMDDYGP